MSDRTNQAECAERSWHAMGGDEVVRALASHAQRGLADDEVERRLARYGANVLPEARRRSRLSLILHQFASPLIYLLFAAAALALALGEVSDAIVIAVVVVLNAIIGAVQEGRAESALAALRQMTIEKATVVRAGHEQVVDASELVPGDILTIAAGDAVTADARLIDAAALQVAEAALTGESVPVPKDVAPVAADAALADRDDMVYAGTHATAGRARAIVIGTGLATEIGRIATMTERATPQKTPLERRIDHFGRLVMIGALATLGVFFVVGLLRGLPLGQIGMLGISQVVGMVPEGLPVALTIALAVGVQRMAKRRAIVRRLSAVETLGSTTVICSDKTGTLTRNEMTAVALRLPGRDITVTGSGYEPEGAFVEAGHELAQPGDDEDLRTLLEAAVLCNDAELVAPGPDDSRWRPVGDPTEAALVTLARKAGLIAADVRDRFRRQAEIPFASSIKLMATQHATPAGPRIYVKGAPEAILELCGSVREGGTTRAIDEATRSAVRTAVEDMADRALRVLAFAVVEDAELDAAGIDDLRGRATLIGVVGQIDPPRSEAAVAVAQCRAAGIRPVMVTGDHKATAHAVARTLGIAREGDVAIDGRELGTLSDHALAAKLDQIAVFARVHPAQKIRIVDAYQQRHEVVAMTGDGVNDAPALVNADVGVAMGITGTAVAKEASKVIITDDNFSTIVTAVEEGRVAYRNIKKVVLFLFATSLAEVLVLLLAVAIGYPPPFAAVQILWNNLVTEGVITVNLVMSPAEGDEMQRPPISPHERLVTRPMLKRLALMSGAIVVSTLGWFIFRIESGIPFAVARSETFALLAVCEWFNVLNCLSARRSALSLRVFENPWLIGGLVVGNLLQLAVIFLPPLNKIFYTVPFGIEQVLAIGLAGSLVLWVEELRKLVVRRRERRPPTSAAHAMPARSTRSDAIVADASWRRAR